MINSEHFNQLTPAEHERLVLLAEECAEVVKAAMKILRHGYNSYNPVTKDGRINRLLLEDEVGHVQYALSAMHEKGDISPSAVVRSMNEKAVSVRKYLHHDEDGFVKPF